MDTLNKTIWHGEDGDVSVDVGAFMDSEEEALINLFSQRMTNEANASIAAAQNELNYKMFNEQNQWNLDRRNEEWEYNDPANQMKRMIAAGINPILAAGNISPGSASSLSSANYAGAAGSPAASGSIVSGGQSPLSVFDSFGNSLLSAISDFSKLGIDARRQAVSEAKLPGEIAKNYADAAQSEQQAAVLDSVKQFNLSSFDDRLTLLSRQIEDLNSKIRNEDADTKVKQSQEASLQALTKKAEAETSVIKDYVSQGYERLALGWFSARNQASVDNQQLLFQGQNIEIAKNQFELDKQRFKYQVQHDSVEVLLQLLRSFSSENRAKGSLESSLKIPGTGTGISAGAEYEGKERSINVAKAAAVFDEVFSRYLQDPTVSNLKAFQEAVDLSTPVFSIPQRLPVRQSPSYTPVWNPSY